jgi:PilZ domain-containing protein
MSDDVCTVVIGAQNRLDELRKHAASRGEVLLFADTDALNALETITKRRPQVITLERLFAATSRGAALINRIKADPSLSASEIRVISHDGEYSRVSPRRGAAAAAALAETTAPASRPVQQLDWRGTRRAPRYKMADKTEAQVDGAPAKLVDLSRIGAQVVAQSALKPNQRVRITLLDEAGVLRFNASVAWAAFEIPKGVTRYRAGVEFTDANADAVEAFALRHKV